MGVPFVAARDHVRVGAVSENGWVRSPEVVRVMVGLLKSCCGPRRMDRVRGYSGECGADTTFTSTYCGMCTGTVRYCTVRSTIDRFCRLVLLLNVASLQVQSLNACSNPCCDLLGAVVTAIKAAGRRLQVTTPLLLFNNR